VKEAKISCVLVERRDEIIRVKDYCEQSMKRGKEEILPKERSKRQQMKEEIMLKESTNQDDKMRYLLSQNTHKRHFSQ